MDKFFVLIGHVTSDNYNDAPHYLFHTLPDKEAVLRMYKEWMDPAESGGHKDCSACVFRVVQGKELSLKPVEKVVTYELK